MPDFISIPYVLRPPFVTHSVADPTQPGRVTVGIDSYQSRRCVGPPMTTFRGASEQSSPIRDGLTRAADLS